MGARRAALCDLSVHLREHPELDIAPPRVTGWPRALLDHTAAVPADWRRPGSSPQETIAAWTPVVHAYLDGANRGRPEPRPRALDLYGIARLCAELHAALRTAGIEYAD